MILGAALALMLGACNDVSLPGAEQKKGAVKPAAKTATGGVVIPGEGVTPMENRIAVVGVLNKRNNLTTEIKFKPGDSQRVGDVIVKVAACERTAPWEMPQEIGAFIQVTRYTKSGASGSWKRTFSGWMFRNSPSLNVLEDRVYDVWVKDCIMTFPGEGKKGGPDKKAEGEGGKPAASVTPAASSTPAPSAAPTPSVNSAASETTDE